MRRAAEKNYVTGLTQVGIRNVSSTSKEGYENAKAMNSDILSVRQTRKIGPKNLVGRIPKDSNVYITIDIDAFAHPLHLELAHQVKADFFTTKSSKYYNIYRNKIKL